MKLSCTIGIAAALTGLALPLRGADLVNGIQAVVHDTVITRQDVEEETLKAERELVRQYGRGTASYEKKLAEAENNNLDQLTERQLILHEFKTAGYNLPEKVIDDAVESEVRSRSRGDRQTFIKTLEAEGTTLERYRQRIREQIIERAMREKNVSSEIIISPYKVETYYKEHLESYRLEDRVKLRMIVLGKSSNASAPNARKMAEEIVCLLTNGASFADLAKLYSEGRQGREGGDWGWVERHVLRKELADAAFSLKAGERSGVIETPDSCYLMLVEDIQPAHHRTLSEVRSEIEKELQDKERARLQKQWIDKLRKKTFVAKYY